MKARKATKAQLRAALRALDVDSTWELSRAIRIVLEALFPASDAENYREDWFDGCTGRDRMRARLAAA